MPGRGGVSIFCKGWWRGVGGLDAQPNHHSKPRNNRGPDKYNVSKYGKF